MLFDKLCRYIAYGWGSVETQQIPAILEVADGVRGVVGVGVPHARRSVPEVVTEIECHYPATDSIFGVVRWSGGGTPEPDVSLVDLGMFRLGSVSAFADHADRSS